MYLFFSFIFRSVSNYIQSLLIFRFQTVQMFNKNGRRTCCHCLLFFIDILQQKIHLFTLTVKFKWTIWFYCCYECNAIHITSLYTVTYNRDGVMCIVYGVWCNIISLTTIDFIIDVHVHCTYKHIHCRMYSTFVSLFIEINSNPILVNAIIR